MDLIVLTRGLEGAQSGSQLLGTLDTVVVRAPSPLGLLLLHSGYCRRMRVSGELAERVYCVYMGAGC